MPSPWHDAINELFRERPQLAAEILRDCRGLKDFPIGLSAQVSSPQFNDRPSADFFADTVVVTAGPDGDPAFGVVVEAQQAKSLKKREQLPRYAAAFWLQLRRPVEVLVICREQDVADWYMLPMRTSLRGYTFVPFTVGPRTIPAINDPIQMAANPALATLSFVMHGEQSTEVIDAFIEAMTLLPKAIAPKYTELAHRMSTEALQKIVEEIVATETWPLSTPFAKEHFGRGEANAIFLVLEARGIELTPEQRERINGCTDLGQLSEWVTRAATVSDANELFG
jgi:hypothetical protein